MFTTPTKRHHAEPRPVHTPEHAEGQLNQMARLISPELKNALACSPKDKRASVSRGYLNRSSPIPRAPLSATRSEPCISPYSSSITAPPLFATSQDMYASALQNLSPQRGLQPMCDTFMSREPWVSPARHGSMSSASSSSTSSSSACSSNLTASTSYSTDWNAQTRLFGQPASGRSSKRELSQFEEEQQNEEAEVGEDDDENTGDDTAMCLDPPSPSANRSAASRPMRPLRRKPLFGGPASSSSSSSITSSSSAPRRGTGLDRTQSLPSFGSGDDWMRTDAAF